MEESIRVNPLEDTPARAAARKQDHIEICRKSDVESRATRNSSSYFFAPEALPNFNPSDTDTAQQFLGTRFSLPYLMTGMTGGVADGQRINEILAQAAERWNIPMGLGSQKLMVTEPSYRKLFDVRKVAPRAFLIGNIGAVSFNYGVTTDDVLRLVDDLELNAFAVHLNALQEQIQPEGERNFAHLEKSIEQLVKKLSVQVMVKEVGSGMTAQTCRRLLDLGVAAIDVGGSGGTSWSVIEGLRGDRVTSRIGELFRPWGLSTLESVEECSQIVTSYGRQLVATGGVRNGLQAAILLGLGAKMCGVGLPFFRAVVDPAPGLTAEEALQEEIQFFARSLEIAMYCSGSQSIEALQKNLRKRAYS